MRTETVLYEVDGIRMRGQLLKPATDLSKKPGVVIFPDAFGLGDHALQQAERFVQAGHVAFACDLHGNGERWSDLPTVLEFVGRLQQDARSMRARARGGVEALQAATGLAPDRIAAVGYCLGGTLALELARARFPIAAAIGLHCGLGSPLPADESGVSARILVCLGADDPFVPAAERAEFESEMRRAGADWQLHLYGGVVHSFTDRDIGRMNQPLATRYDAGADARSWQAIQNVLGECPGA